MKIQAQAQELYEYTLQHEAYMEGLYKGKSIILHAKVNGGQTITNYVVDVTNYFDLKY